jgi:TetR/AcrR family transcriptional regulator, transcriptional repressor of bet genes
MARKAAPESVRREQILRAAFEVAARKGLGGLTLRAVAAEAALSHALVLFYFGRKARLLHDLLEWLIASSPALHPPEDAGRIPRALDRLHALLQQEMARLAGDPRRTRLFLEYWALGARHPPTRERICVELERYRTAFRAIMAELLLSDTEAFAGVTSDGMAAVAVSWIHGCAVQAVAGEEAFDPEAYLSAVRAIVGQLTRPPRAG